MSQLVACDLCNTELLQKRFARHKNKCPKRPIECEYCYTITPYDVWVGVHGKECEICERQCKFCHEKVMNKDMCDHLNNCQIINELFDKKFYNQHLGSAQFYSMAQAIKKYRQHILLQKELKDISSYCIDYGIENLQLIDMIICMNQFYHPEILNRLTRALQSSSMVFKLGDDFIIICKSLIGNELTTEFIDYLIERSGFVKRNYWGQSTGMLDEKYGKKIQEYYDGFCLIRYYIKLGEKEVMYDIIDGKKAFRYFIRNLKEFIKETINPNLSKTILGYLFDEYLLKN
jgi:hypothetical protein